MICTLSIYIYISPIGSRIHSCVACGALNWFGKIEIHKPIPPKNDLKKNIYYIIFILIFIIITIIIILLLLFVSSTEGPCTLYTTVEMFQ